MRGRVRIVQWLRAVPIRWRILSIAALNSAVVVVLAVLIWNGSKVLGSAWDDVRQVRESDKILALLESEGMRWMLPDGALNLELAGALAWSVLGMTLGGSSLLYLLIQRGAATTVTSLMYLVPPTTALMAWVLFGEPITTLIVGGMALTAVGVSLVVRPPRS